MQVATGLVALAHVFGKGVGGQRDHGRAWSAHGLLVIAQLARDGQSVHTGHLHVHEDQVIAVRTRHAQRCGAVGGDVDVQRRVVQHGHEEVDVDFVVLGEQQPPRLGRVARRQRRGRCRSGSGRVGCVGCAGPVQRRQGRGRQHGGQREDAAAAGRAGHDHVAVHAPGHAARDGQTQAGAAETAGDAVVGLHEGLEDAVDLVGVDADAGVRHLKAQEIGPAGRRADAQRDAALRGELQRVGQQVHQRMLHTCRVADNDQRHAGRALKVQLQRPRLQLRPEQVFQAVQHLTQCEGRCFQHQVAGFDLGQVQQRVDQRAQRLAGLLEHPHMLALLGRQRGTGQQFGHAQHGVQRRADLVADVGQERRLGLVGGGRNGALVRQAQPGRFLGPPSQPPAEQRAHQGRQQCRCGLGLLVAPGHGHGACQQYRRAGAQPQQRQPAQARARGAQQCRARQAGQQQQQHLHDWLRRPQQAVVAQCGVGLGDDLGALHLAPHRHHPIGQQRAAADEHRAALHRARQRGVGAVASGTAPDLPKGQHPHRLGAGLPQRLHLAVCIERPCDVDRAAGRQQHGQCHRRPALALCLVPQRHAAQLAVVVQCGGQHAHAGRLLG